MFKRSGMLVLACVSLSACFRWQDGLIKQAAFDHRCSEDRVEVLRESGDPVSRTADVTVCGKERRYRDLGGARAIVWTDITDTVPSGVSPPSAPAPTK